MRSHRTTKVTLAMIASALAACSSSEATTTIEAMHTTSLHVVAHALPVAPPAPSACPPGVACPPFVWQPQAILSDVPSQHTTEPFVASEVRGYCSSTCNEVCEGAGRRWALDVRPSFRPDGALDSVIIVGCQEASDP